MAEDLTVGYDYNCWYQSHDRKNLIPTNIVRDYCYYGNENNTTDTYDQHPSTWLYLTLIEFISTSLHVCCLGGVLLSWANNITLY
jgi:hypothetical protein